ncbi:MAG: ABC transporter ATP-binding protein/permease [Methanobacterium sp.]|jgi:ATP-binding cassette subfamily B protein|nr:ABC transporter ATP-binding protein/permease [Methanobacterium sp.]
MSTNGDDTNDMVNHDKENHSRGRLSTLRRLLGYLTRYKLRFTLIVLTMFGYSLMLTIIPAFLGEATNIITKGPGPLSPLQNTIYMLIIAIIFLWVFGYTSQRLLADIAQKALYNLRTELFSQIQKFSLSFFDQRPIGQLMSRVTNDLDVVDQFFSVGVMQLIQSIFTVVLATIIMLYLNVGLTILTYLTILGMMALSGILSRISGPAFEHLQEQMAELNGFAEEHISGQKTVIAYRQQESTASLFDKLSQKVNLTGQKAQFAALVNQPAALVFANLQIIVLLLVGGYLIIEGQVVLGELIAFIGFASELSAPLTQIFSTYSQIISATVGANRVFQIMDGKPEIVDREAAPPMPIIEGEVDFLNVDFSYVPGRKILKNNTFSAQPGETIGLCGPTGAGKSTIINILTRYYDLDSGEIRVDEERIDEIQQDTLRIQIAQVLQEPFLFSDTIMNNLRYAREGASDEDCIRAAKQANAHNFIIMQPQGYDTILQDGGADLSQGQRQMLTIARAMVAEPRMLILDEATSNVDTRTEKLIQEGLLKLQEGKTSFIIAHRLSTIQDADQILVIDKGEIIERGSHEELMKMNGFYHELFMSQFRGKISEGNV